MVKRYEVKVGREGLCSVCQLRDGEGAFACCRGFPDREQGGCKTDGQLPAFRLDPATLEGMGNG